MTQAVAVSATALPLRPGTATQVLAMLGEEDASAREIGEVVKTEPAITARLLALANSPIFRRGSEIADINRAVIAVGLSSVRGITLGVAMDSLFEDESVLDPQHWEHALRAAGAAVAAAKHTGADASEAFCAGLMHDIGQIAMTVSAPEIWSQIIHETDAGSCERLTLEEELFGSDHARLGTEVLVEFGLPARLTIAVGTHHQPLDEIETPLGRCVAIGEAVARLTESDVDPLLELEQLLPTLTLDAEPLLAEAAQQTESLRVVFAR